MTLKKKIILSFLVSSVIIAALAVTALVTFVEVRKEIGHLELADTLRTTSLQLRRHEKNFFLYGDPGEMENVSRYVSNIKAVIGQSGQAGNGKLLDLSTKTDEYARRFDALKKNVTDFRTSFDRLKTINARYAAFFPLIESTFLERPDAVAAVLERIFDVPRDDPILMYLGGLSSEIPALRRNGEEILTISRELDRSVRERVENAINRLQAATMILFPLFFLIGFATLFFISQSVVISQGVVNKLQVLTGSMEKTGRGDFRPLPSPEKGDEAGVLINAFNRLEQDLINRDEEIRKKNEELHRSRKLASIGTLASGVAHELNNPLNNIYVSAQILQQEAKDNCSPLVREIVGDIVGQSVRVKRVVADLIDYARGKEPMIREMELIGLIRGVERMLKVSVDVEDVNFVMNSDCEQVELNADPEQMERVFINLFTNAVEAMAGKGEIVVTLKSSADSVKIWVSDSGKGMTPEEMEKIFEPFFTTKDKGTGLGLAIVYSIIKNHGGDIFVDSEKDKGTTFHVTLPRKGATVAA